jgi:GAF domain-containing protein
MSESIFIDYNISKEEQYRQLIPQIQSLMSGDKDEIACMANLTAALKEVFNWLWVGFYRVQEDELVLGPFQGQIACTRIAFGKGVCGTAWKEKRTIWVPDVEKFPGHIACSAASRSEIVVPIFDEENYVCAVLDIDSERMDELDETDGYYLEKICTIFAQTRN